MEKLIAAVKNNIIGFILLLGFILGQAYLSRDRTTDLHAQVQNLQTRQQKDDESREAVQVELRAIRTELANINEQLRELRAKR